MSHAIVEPARAGRRPPSPQLAALVQTYRFLVDPFRFIDDTRSTLGDVFSLRMIGLGDWTFVCSPELVKELFKAPTDVLAAGEVNAKQLGFVVGLDATFSLDRQDHLDRRRLVFPYFNGRNVLRYVEVMRELTESALAQWRPAEPFALLPRMHRLSLDVLMRVMFRESDPRRVRELTDLFDRFATEGLRSPLMALPPLQLDLGGWSPWGRVLKLRAAVRTALAAEIAERAARATESEEGGDIVQALLDVEQKDGTPLRPEAILDEVITLLFAGHETTGAILTWCVECLLDHPEVLARVRDELARELGERPIEASDVGRLPFLEAVIQESIRYRPIAPMAGLRLVKQPFELGGFTLAPGSIVTQCFPAMTRREDLFARPQEFDPGHFFERKLRPYDWNPFGGGTRMCIGKGLAEIELLVVLATVLRRVTLRLAQDGVRPVRHGFFFAPSHGLRVVLQERIG